MSTRLPEDGQPEFKLKGWARFWLDLFIAAIVAAGLIGLAIECSIGDDACAALSAWT